MPATRMSHPLNGYTHAYDTGEIDRLKGLGWSVESKQEPIKPVEPAPLSQLEKNTAATLADHGIPASGTQIGNAHPGPLVNEQSSPARAKPGPKPK